MPDPFYSKPTADQTRRLKAGGGATSISVGMFVRVTDWPETGTDVGVAEICGDAAVPHMVVETDLSDTGTSGVASFCARDGVRARAGGTFAADDYLKLSGGKLVKASTGNTSYYQAMTPSTAVNSLPLVRWVGKTTAP